MEIQIERKKDGFAGEIYIVLPTEAFSEYAEHPLVRRLYLTDAGFFPHAAHHYRERSEGLEEYILLCCTSGRGMPFGSSFFAVRSLTSGVTDSHGVTGGVYKTRQRIHRGILIRDY